MMLYKLLQRMDPTAFASRVVTLTGRGAIADRIESLGIPVECLGMRRGVPEPGALWQLVRLLRRERPAVVQTWLYHSDLLGLLAGRMAGVPAVAWNIRCSVMDERYTRGLNRMVLRLLAVLSRRPTMVIANSEAGVALHRQLGYRPRRWELVPNGFDLERFRPDAAAYRDVRQELNLAADSLLVGLIARFDPIKDHATFLQAAHRLAQSNGRVHFLLAGGDVDSHNAALRLAASAGPASERVHLLGERSDIPRLTAALDIATCSSTGEGFPNILGEAMACAVPVVTTDVGDAAKIVGDTGIVVPSRDATAFAAAIAKVLDLPSDARRTLGQRARQRIADNFDLAGVAARYAALYREMAGRSAI